MSRRNRLTVIIVTGILTLSAMASYRATRFPEAAPREWQESGLQQLREHLAFLRSSDFGQSPRGRQLTAKVESFLANGQIIFSAALGGPRGLWWSGWFSRERIYLRILKMSEGRFVHQLPEYMIEAIFHEAVHSLQGKFHRNSLEEENDAFLADYAAEMIVTEQTLPEVFHVDSKTLWEFVVEAYPELKSNGDYEPIGTDLDFIYVKAGRLEASSVAGFARRREPGSTSR